MISLIDNTESLPVTGGFFYLWWCNSNTVKMKGSSKGGDKPKAKAKGAAKPNTPKGTTERRVQKKEGGNAKYSPSSFGPDGSSRYGNTRENTFHAGARAMGTGHTVYPPQNSKGRKSHGFIGQGTTAHSVSPSDKKTGAVKVNPTSKDPKSSSHQKAVNARKKK